MNLKDPYVQPNLRLPLSFSDGPLKCHTGFIEDKHKGLVLPKQTTVKGWHRARILSAMC